MRPWTETLKSRSLACHTSAAPLLVRSPRSGCTGAAAQLFRQIPFYCLAYVPRREQKREQRAEDAEERKDRGIAAAAGNNNVQNTKLVRVINKMGPKRGRPAARDEHGSNMLRVQIKSIGSIGRFKYIKEIVMGAPHEGGKSACLNTTANIGCSYSIPVKLV